MPGDRPNSWKHRQRREALLPYAYGKACPRCGELMHQGEDLDLGHTVDHITDPNAVGDRIEHASCNRSAGGKLAHQRSRFDQSRDW